MATTNIDKIIAHAQQITENMYAKETVRYNREYQREVVREARDLLLSMRDDLDNPTSRPADMELSTTDWLEYSEPGDYAVVLYNRQLTVEWISGTRSWDVIDAAEIIGTVDRDRIIDAWEGK